MAGTSLNHTGQNLEAMYKPLNRNNREIRLLVLEDAIKTEDRTSTILKCRFKYTSLPPRVSHWLHPKNWFRPRYHALSYVWGDSTPTHHIEINNRMIKITRNLADALLAIWNSTKYRLIWADAFCINQQDDFYQRAISLKMTNDRQDNMESYFHALCGGFCSDEAIKAVDLLYSRPYWSRMWIVQELAKASSTTFLCGQDKLDNLELGVLAAWIFNLISEGKTFLTQNPVFFECFRSLTSGNEGMKIICAILCYYKRPEFLSIVRKTKKHESKPLLKLLHLNFRSRNCLHSSERRDSPFALVGLASDTINMGVSADYTQPAIYVFYEFTRKLIFNGHSEVICLACHEKSLEGIPSWVPDWSKGEPIEMSSFGD